MTQVESGQSAAASGEGHAPQGSAPDGLDDLRADLARMILSEAGQAVSRNPELPLSLTLVRAIERQAAQSAQNAAERIPSAEALSDAVLDVVGPELIRIARAAGTGDAVALARQKSKDGGRSRILLAAAGAVAAGILLFVAGFVTAKLLPGDPAPAPAVVSTPPVGEPGLATEGVEAGVSTAAPTPPAAAPATPAAKTGTRPAR